MAVHQIGGAVHGSTGLPATLEPQIAPQPPEMNVVVCGASQATTSAGDWLIDKVAPPLIVGLILALFASWAIPRALERFRGERDHLHRTLDALRTQIWALQKVAADYWSEPWTAKRSPAQEAEIEYLLQDISALSSACAPKLWEGIDDAGPELVAQLAAAVTGSEFGRPRRSPEPGRCREIGAMAASLTRRLTADRAAYFSDWTLKRSVKAWAAACMSRLKALASGRFS